MSKTNPYKSISTTEALEDQSKVDYSDSRCCCITGDRKEHPRGVGKCAFTNQPKTMKDLLYDCFCTGNPSKPHSKTEQGCFYRSFSSQMLPPPNKEASPGGDSNNSPSKINEQTSVFAQKAGWQDFKDLKVTREHEILAQAFNKATRTYSKEWMQVLDNGVISLGFIDKILDEMHLMGYICEEEMPFGTC